MAALHRSAKISLISTTLHEKNAFAFHIDNISAVHNIN